MAAYLSRTPASSGSQRIFTYSAWVKKCDFSSGILLSSGESDGDPNFAIYFDSSSRLNILFYSGASTVLQYITNRVFRDVSAWYHIVVKVDTTQATASDRVQLYVNGVEETSFSTETDPSQNFHKFKSKTLGKKSKILFNFLLLEKYRCVSTWFLKEFQLTVLSNKACYDLLN